MEEKELAGEGGKGAASSPERPSATLEGIKQAALDEFLEKGFAAASLRRIVKSAGVTTGAFYGYFSSKEALFASIVEPHAAALMGRFMDAQLSFFELSEEEQVEHIRRGTESSSYIKWMVGYICQNRDPVKVLLSKSEGTGYEHFVHNMVQVEVESTLRYMDVLRRMGKKTADVGESLCHILASGMFTGIFEVAIHDMPYDEAMRDVESLRRFYAAGWRILLEGEQA